MLDEDARGQLREQKRRLDKEFGVMLSKIADRKERLVGLEEKLQKLDRARQVKEEELRDLERKLVVLLEEQQRELELIRRRQEKKGELLTTAAENANPALIGALVPSGGAGGGSSSGPSSQQKKQANALMQSTETLMKFGFMSMSMTYFSSLNMIKALRQVGAHQTMLGSDGNGGGDGMMGGGGGMGEGGKVLEPFQPGLKPGMLPGQEPLLVAAWSVDDVGRWLDTLSLPQYRQSFADAAVDGAFLYDLNDEVCVLWGGGGWGWVLYLYLKSYLQFARLLLWCVVLLLVVLLLQQLILFLRFVHTCIHICTGFEEHSGHRA